MKCRLLFFLFLISASCAQAQCSITAKVIDDHQKPLEEVLARLLKSKDSTLVKYTSSNAEGLIRFDNFDTGSYLLHFSSFGYEDHYVSIKTDSTHAQLKPEDIVMQTHQLNEVTVTARIPVIQHY